MEKFAGYGFNKSHSAAYALLAYQTAWLKAHYPAYFMASVLSSDMDNTDKVAAFVDECVQMKIRVHSPDINKGQYEFTVIQLSEIYYGLGAIKGVGRNVIEALVEERKEGGDFNSLLDFCKRVDCRKTNRRVLEALARSGAFDCFGAHRASLLASVESALQQGLQAVKDRETGQHGLFTTEDFSAAEPAFHYVTSDPWPESKRLEMEKQALGFYLTGHPFTRYQNEFSHLVTGPIGELSIEGNKIIRVAGVVTSVRTLNTKRGDRMAFVALSDGSGKIEMAVFSDDYQTHRDVLVKDAVLWVEGEAQLDDYSGGYRMRADRMMTVDAMRNHFAKGLLIKLSSESVSGEAMDTLKSLLSSYRGGKLPVFVEVTQQAQTGRFMLGKDWQVSIQDPLLDALEMAFEDQCVEVVY